MRKRNRKRAREAEKTSKANYLEKSEKEKHQWGCQCEDLSHLSGKAFSLLKGKRQGETE